MAVIQMTESEWSTCLDSYSMFRRIRLIANRYPRKCRLFAAACCYRIWHLLSDERSRRSVELAVQFAEGFVDEDQLKVAAEVAQAAHAEAFRAVGKIDASAEWAAQFAASPDAWFAMTRASNFACVAAGDGHQGGPEHSAQELTKWLKATIKSEVAAVSGVLIHIEPAQDVSESTGQDSP